MLALLRAVGRTRLWRWLVFENLARLADMAAKLAAVVIAIAAIDVFLLNPKLEIAQASCASEIDLRVLGQHYASAESVPRRLRAFALRFDQARQLTGGGASVVVRRDRSTADCRPDFVPFPPASGTKGGRKRRLLSQLQIGSVGLLPADLYNAFFRSIRLRPHEMRAIELRTGPGRLGVNPAAFGLQWDADRQVNNRLVWVLIVVAGAILVTAVTRDILALETIRE